MFEILCGEIVFSSSIDMNLPKIKVTKDFYEVLKKPPHKYESDDGNAYIFGKIYTSDKYELIGGFNNDAASCSLFDITNISKKEITKIEKYKYEEDEYLDQYYDDLNNPKFLEILQNEISPRILFIGETIGGDVGADVYVHYNAKRQIDSLMIDNSYFFDDSSSEDSNDSSSEDSNDGSRR